MNINIIKCKIVSRLLILLILLFAILTTSLLSMIQTGINMYKGIIIVASLMLVVICTMFCFKIKQKKDYYKDHRPGFTKLGAKHPIII